MNLGELFVQIGAIGSSKEVKAFGEAVKKAGKAIDDYDKKLKKAQGTGEGATVALKGTIGAIAGLVTAAAGAYWALDRLTDSLVKQNLQWLNLARQSDIALSTFQKWGTIGKIVGVDNAAQQLENLNQKIFNLRLTGEGAKGFQMAGIMPTNSEDVLEQLRNRISGMSNTAATYLLQQMGLDPKMITLLRMGREEWEQYLEIQKKYTLNQDQRKEIDRLNRQLEVARIKMQYLKDKMVLALMPAFVKLAKVLGNIASGLEKVIRWITKSSSGWATFTRIILIVLGGAIALVSVLKTAPVIIMAITTAIGLLRNAIMLLTAHPIIAGITALLGAIILIADDIIGYYNGKNSVFGAIINGLKDIDIKGFIDFPVPKWLEYIIYMINFFKTHKFMIPLVGSPFGALATAVNPLIKMRNKGQNTFQDKALITGASPFTRNINNSNTKNQNTTVNQTNYIQTSETTNELDWSLRFWQQQAQQGT